MKAATCVLLAVALARVGATGMNGSECGYDTNTTTPTPTPPPPPPVDCELYTVVSDPFPWGPCKLADDYSGKYFRTKILSVKTQPANNGTACPSEDDPVRLVTEQCKPINCTAKTPEQDLDNPFGPCTDDGTGVFYRNKTLGVAEDAQNGGSCDASERLYKELCEAKPCVVKTPEQDNGTFTECFPDNSTSPVRWIKTKVLQLTTLPENGGSCPSEAERTLTEVCPPVNCVRNTPEEDTGDYGPCRFASGSYVKSKELGIKVNATYGGTCDVIVFTQPCAAIDCVVKTPEEDTKPFGNCTDDGTGKYYRSKVLDVKSEAQYGGVDCPPPENRTISLFCEPVNCTAKTPEQDLDNAFGNCTDDGTGIFYRNKTLGVLTPESNGGSCDPAERLYKELCEAKPCVVNTPEEDTGNFTECFQDNSTSQAARWIKTKVLELKTLPENGGFCPSVADRTVTEVCEPVNCIPVAPEEDTKPFGNCTELAGTNTYFRYKVLDVKVNATYGGTCDEKDRTISAFCEPVDCVANTPEEDKQPFGNCTQLNNTGKYYKSKVLGIKQPALFGGKQCDAKKLALSVLCPAVDCVVNTLAEDRGNFSATCKKMGNEYYKTKVLGIKTQPLYGGKACPSEADRTVKQLCPNDGYCVPTDTFYDTCIPKLAQCSAQRKGVEYEGGQISLTEGLAVWQCCDKCSTTAGCKAYTFYPADASSYGAGKKSKCHLWWEITDKDDGYGSVVSSSPKSPKPAACEYYDDRWLGTLHSEIKGFDTDDLDKCCAACKATRGCVAFELSSGYCSLRKNEGVRLPWFNTKVGYPI